MTAQTNIEQAWQFVFGTLFHPGTKLLYDYRTNTEADGTVRHLPTKEEIASNIPNRCGWFSGMEDSNINGGSMLDAVLYRYERTGEETMKRYASDLYEGLMLNATLSRQPGFLIRSRHPEDGVTHYVNSSRDQYTHWIHSMLRFYHSELSNESQRVEIREALVRMAQKAERDVTAENGWCLTDENGGIALVCSMLGEHTRSHESLRLAMFYLAAYAVTKDAHWRELYRSARDWGLELGEKIREDHCRRSFALVQMQISVKVLYEYEEEPSYRERYGRLMEVVAECSEPYVPTARENLRGKSFPEIVIPWRDCPEEHVWRDTDPYGYRSVMPDVYRAVCGDDIWQLRNAADSLTVQGLCDSYRLKREQADILTELLETHSLGVFPNFVPVYYCLAWELLLRKEKSIL